MKRLDKSDYLTAIVSIHLTGADFYRAAYDKDPTPDNLKRYLQIQETVNQKIAEAING